MGWVWFFATVLFGLCLYWLRCRRRYLYGVAEFLFSLLIIYLTFSPHSPAVLGIGGDTLLDRLMPQIVQIFVGVYALVRGMDNIVTGLREV
jgi:hypothetical protein